MSDDAHEIDEELTKRIGELKASQADMYVVVCEHSHTDRNHLWRVMTRPLPYLIDAEVWKETYQQEYPERKFFIIKVVG